jgi:hypothetical protein
MEPVDRIRAALALAEREGHSGVLAEFDDFIMPRYQGTWREVGQHEVYYATIFAGGMIYEARHATPLWETNHVPASQRDFNRRKWDEAMAAKRAALTMLDHLGAPGPAGKPWFPDAERS